MTKSQLFEPNHRVHDYRHLITRWRRIAKASGLKLEAFAQAGEYPVYCLRAPARGPQTGGFYLSTGIHGDEPAAPEAVACWAEAHLSELVHGDRSFPLLILPCLNPWGLVNNRRSDARGNDLNRLFNRSNLSPIRELKKLITGSRFAFGLTLHEDFDAQGIYGYEVNDHPPDWGAALLEHCAPAIPPDPRRRIEGRVFMGGMMLRRGTMPRLRMHPENLYLHRHGHATHTLTFETPSEFSLASRVQAHVLLIEECVKRMRAEKAGRE